MHGMFPGFQGFQVMKTVRMIAIWINVAERGGSANMLQFMAVQIFDAFPKTDRVQHLRDSFERYCNFKTCVSGYGAPMA